MKKYLFISLLTAFLGLTTTSCEILEDFTEYSRITIQDDGLLTLSDNKGYKDLVVTIGDEEYTAFGTYKVPNNTIVKISWSYIYHYVQYGYSKESWKTSSAEIMVGEFEQVTATLTSGQVDVKR